MKAEYRDNEQSYLDYYDEVEICADSSKVHCKSAIQVRTGVWLTILIWSFAVFSIKAVERIKLCSMLKSKENKSEIGLTANFDSGNGLKVGD